MKSALSFLALQVLLNQANGTPLLARDRDYDSDHGCRVKYVVVLSIDGLHNSDVDKWLALGPSNISTLLETGYRYTDAYTTGPSDSFPGTLSAWTGANPKTTGVWYDDTYDRTYFAPIVYDESIDYNSTQLFSGGINPANLPQTLINGKCTAVYPHARTRVNTAFEVVVRKGLKTAYTDKHPAYDLVRGPSGKGLSTGYFPEIAATDGKVPGTIAYDQLHVNALLDWFDGKDVANAEGSLGGKLPTLSGGNFQAVSVAQKTHGYVNGTLAFTDALKQAMTFVDASLGALVEKLKAKDIYDQTLIVIASKHGQAPIDPAKFKDINPKNVTAATGVKVAFQTSDDIALIFLANQKDLHVAVAGLTARKADLKISDIIYGQRLIDLHFGDPTKDPAVPDIIIVPQAGIIYTTSKSKIAEHGGLSDDDRHIAVFMSNPHLKKMAFGQRVYATQVAPTILGALGLNANELDGVRAERTEALPGFHNGRN
ncbi:type I phosphodiesterase/nucleotide pyrophosphatase [Paraphaeosphaeria sporulosa]|uniref:Type I phosphodiesterase/nucleotide pyrophosphatase n=1 Tax=Paraphaeosphaeria sporulosa TaxID=1460663 RepID=A0A177CG18_9PLEO|nr:type I phosphodiesterase/nucleotide pyrophosphatase [Paraphaeosphaeria sporulosa]OAG06555.1 type I phosphodiesterase/nucleotide pyrophosphatase [Paraphaeosphaeria sporulosa]